jgi:hypothetical protein
MIIDLLCRFRPEPDGLLARISEHIDDEMLRQISLADYGQDSDEHLGALRAIRDEGIFPCPMRWCPAEVLELIRWSEPADPSWKPGGTGDSGHWMRAFCCAALLRATSEPWNYGDRLGTDSTVVQMILSLGALPIDLNADEVRFLASLLLQSAPETRDEQVCAYGVGLFWCALNCPSLFGDEAVIPFAQWILRNRKCDRSSSQEIGELREMVTGCQKQPSWEVLALKFLELDLSTRSGELQAYARLIAEQLLN